MGLYLYRRQSTQVSMIYLILQCCLYGIREFQSEALSTVHSSLFTIDNSLTINYQLYTAVCGLTPPIGIHIYQLLCLCQYSTNCLVNAQRSSHSLSTVMAMMYIYLYGPCTSTEWQTTWSVTQCHHARSHCAVFTTRGGLFSVCYTSSHDKVCIQSIS